MIDLFWSQSAALFDRWLRLLDSDPARVQRECALFRRWIDNLPIDDADSETIREVLLEMAAEMAEMMVEATLRRG